MEELRRCAPIVWIAVAFVAGSCLAPNTALPVTALLLLGFLALVASRRFRLDSVGLTSAAALVVGLLAHADPSARPEAQRELRAEFAVGSSLEHRGGFVRFRGSCSAFECDDFGALHAELRTNAGSCRIILAAPLSHRSKAKWIAYSGEISGRGWLTAAKPGQRVRLTAAISTLRAGRHWTSPQQLRECIGLAIDKELRQQGAVRSLARRLLLGEGKTDHVHRLHARLGLAHLLAVSGLHVLIVAGLLARVTLCLPARLRLGFFCTLLIGYAWLAGARPPIIRAAVAAGLWFLARERGQALSWRSVLAAAAIVTALHDAAALTSASFMFSYAAVLGIAWLAPWLRQRGARLAPSYPRSVETLAVSTAAWLLTAPLSLHFFGTTSFWGIVWTPLALPWIACLLLTGICGLLLLPFGFAQLAFDAFALTAQAYFAFLELGDGLPAAPLFATRPLPLGSIAVLYGIGLPLALSLGSRLLLTLMLGLTLLASFVPGPGLLAPAASSRPRAASVGRHLAETAARASVGGTVVHVLDVGHGLCVLATLGNRIVVIDCGALAGGRRASRKLLTKMRELGYARIDRFVLTHGDRDHWNGLPDVLVRVPIGKAILLESAGTAAAQRTLRRAGVACDVLAPGAQRLLAGRRIAVHAPLQDADVAGDNESSLLVVVRPAACEPLVLCSDQESAGVRAAMSLLWSTLLARPGAAHPRLQLDPHLLDPMPIGALVLPHHGSHSDEIERWIDVLRPRICVASTSSGRGVAAEWSRQAWRAYEPWTTALHGDLRLTSGSGRWLLQTQH